MDSPDRDRTCLVQHYLLQQQVVTSDVVPPAVMTVFEPVAPNLDPLRNKESMVEPDPLIYLASSLERLCTRPIHL